MTEKGMPLHERIARRVCEEDPAAPHPDAIIWFGNRQCKAWETRVPEEMRPIKGKRRQ